MVDGDSGSRGDRELKGSSMARARLFFPIASALDADGLEDVIPPCVPSCCRELDALMSRLSPATGDEPDAEAAKTMHDAAVRACVASSAEFPSRRGTDYKTAMSKASVAECAARDVDLGVPREKAATKPPRKRARPAAVQGSDEFVQAVEAFRERFGDDEQAAAAQLASASVAQLPSTGPLADVPESVAKIVGDILERSSSVSHAEGILRQALAHVDLTTDEERPDA
jgi:hypothetical protein